MRFDKDTRSGCFAASIYCIAAIAASMASGMMFGRTSGFIVLSIFAAIAFVAVVMAILMAAR